MRKRKSNMDKVLAARAKSAEQYRVKTGRGKRTAKPKRKEPK